MQELYQDAAEFTFAQDIQDTAEKFCNLTALEE